MTTTNGESRAQAWAHFDLPTKVDLILNELDQFARRFDRLESQIESVKEMTRIRLNLIAGIGVGILTSVIAGLVLVAVS